MLKKFPMSKLVRLYSSLTSERAAGGKMRMKRAECASVGSTPGDASPADSSNFSSSLFSSSATVGASSSFASSFHDPPPPPHTVQNVFGRQEPTNRRPAAPDLLKFHTLLNRTLLISSSKRDQSQVVPNLDSRSAAAGHDGTLANATESTRTSFALAVKECHLEGTDSLQKISDSHRPLSLDLNNINVSACSPRLEPIKQSSILKHCSGALTSPVTPNYRQTSDTLHKGWSSERVPLPQNGNRRQVGAAHFSFNQGGTLPSKWEDAERWIFGPTMTDIGFKQSVPPTQRRPRSKSGPLGASGVFYYSAHSPAVHTFDGIHGGNLLTGSPFSAGSMPGHRLQTGYACNLGCSANSDFVVTRSDSIHGCRQELLNQLSIPYSPRMDEERDDDLKDPASDVSRAVLRRDMATQMSPDGSPCSSSRKKHSVSSALSMVEMRSSNSPRLDGRDVEVDERVTDTVTRWSKKKSHRSGRGNENVDNWATKTAMTWDISETAKDISKVRKEEARIAAWENLQKAKADAAVTKLEMKLEKKRSSSMDKIMKKLRLAKKKSEEMRRAVLAKQAQPVSNSSNRTISLRPTRPMSSLSGCFTCHAFNT